MSITMMIDGMNCGHCSAKVKRALERLSGVSAEVSHEKKCAVIEMTDEHSDQELMDAVTAAGFSPRSISRDA